MSYPAASGAQGLEDGDQATVERLSPHDRPAVGGNRVAVRQHEGPGPASRRIRRGSRPAVRTPPTSTRLRVDRAVDVDLRCHRAQGSVPTASRARATSNPASGSSPSTAPVPGGGGRWSRWPPVRRRPSPRRSRCRGARRGPGRAPATSPRSRRGRAGASRARTTSPRLPLPRTIISDLVSVVPASSGGPPAWRPPGTSPTPRRPRGPPAPSRRDPSPRHCSPPRWSATASAARRAHSARCRSARRTGPPGTDRGRSGATTW